MAGPNAITLWGNFRKEYGVTPMKRALLAVAMTGLLLTMACSRPTNVGTEQNSGNPVAPAEIKLAATTSYVSGTTQSVMVNVAKLDESKGVVASASGGCVASGPAEQVAPGSYKISVTIPAHPEDGTCSLRLASVADGGAGSVNLSYMADPEYWKRTNPVMFGFANSKVWTFHSGSDIKIFHLLQVSPGSGNKLGVLLVGDSDSRAGMSVGADNSVVGEFEGCVIEGKFAGSMATLKPMMAGDSCQGITTVTLMVSN